MKRHKNPKPLNVAFDIDDTLWKCRKGKNQVPRYELIAVLTWFYNNGDNVFIWSAGGVEYAKQIAFKLGLDDMVTVIDKGELGAHHSNIDISFDDSEMGLAKVNCLIADSLHVKHNL